MGKAYYAMAAVIKIKRDTAALKLREARLGDTICSEVKYILHPISNQPASYRIRKKAGFNKFGRRRNKMTNDCNPTQRRGDRNLFCSNYNNCLDKAIARSWHSWNCHKCKFHYSLSDEIKGLTPTCEEIVEYGLMMQPSDMRWNLPDDSFDCRLDVVTVY
jgi:hypothetical protein